MNSIDFLMWVKGPAFDIALFIFVLGVLIRILEILILGRKHDLAIARSFSSQHGLETVISRTLPEKGVFKRSPLIILLGYVWHIGWFVVLVMFIPHIELFKDLTGISWAGLPTPMIDVLAVMTIIALIAVLIVRMTHPVMSFLSTKHDYFVWLVTFLPVLTGFMAYHHMIEPYELALGLHILSAEILLIVFPFSKLMHAFTVFMARWYNGAINGRRLAMGGED